MKTKSGKKVIGIRTAIRDMRKSHNDGKWDGWNIDFDKLIAASPAHEDMDK